MQGQESFQITGDISESAPGISEEDIKEGFAKAEQITDQHEISDTDTEKETEISRLETEAQEVASEAVSVSKALEEATRQDIIQQHINNEHDRERSKLIDKLVDVQNSWRDVKERAFALGLGTVAAVFSDYSCLGQQLDLASRPNLSPS